MAPSNNKRARAGKKPVPLPKKVVKPATNKKRAREVAQADLVSSGKSADEVKEEEVEEEEDEDSVEMITPSKKRKTGAVSTPASTSRSAGGQIELKGQVEVDTDIKST